MIEPQTLITGLQTNFNVIQQQVDGLTHADSLLQPPFRGNCLNWVLGHLMQGRDRMLSLLGEATIWTPEQSARYARGSAPITEAGEGVLPLAQIMADFATAQERLNAALKARTAGDLDTLIELIPGREPLSVGEWLRFSVWHETYHTGQTELLRQLAGKNDQVI